MWLCGPYLPSSFLEQTSKFRKMTVKFVSNAAVTRLGFRAVIVATGADTARDEYDNYNEYEEYEAAQRDNLTYLYHNEDYRNYLEKEVF